MEIRTDRIQRWLTGVTFLDEDDKVIGPIHRFDSATRCCYDRKDELMAVADAWAICCPSDIVAVKAKMCVPKELHYKVIVTGGMDVQDIWKAVRATDA